MDYGDVTGDPKIRYTSEVTGTYWGLCNDATCIWT